MTSQQLLSIIVIAMVANAVLIAIALVTMRTSGARGRQAKEPGVAAVGGSMPAAALAGDGALGAEAAAGTSGPSAGAVAGSPDPATATSGDPSSDQWPADPSSSDAHDGNHEDSEDAAFTLLDPATGLESPSAWRRALDDEVVRLARYHRPATVMLVELDGFDRLVDRLGEAAGARIVLATARTLRAEARAADRCARLGRGRFAILLPETDEVRAINFVERVRSECDRWLETGEITLRLAIGWAILDASGGAKTALQEAEHRLDSERRLRTNFAA